MGQSFGGIKKTNHGQFVDLLGTSNHDKIDEFEMFHKCNGCNGCKQNQCEGFVGNVEIVACWGYPFGGIGCEGVHLVFWEQ